MMRVVHELKEAKLRFQTPTSVAIGNFDGCHLGHQDLLSQLCLEARLHNTVPTVLSFYPHPVEVLAPHKRLSHLSTTSEKLDLLSQHHIEQVLLQPFTRDLAQVTPEAFFKKFLLDGLNASGVHVGEGFRFGRDREGDETLLRRLCEEHRLECHVLPRKMIDGIRVSSSYVRQLIAEGNVERAAQYLGRPYVMKGKVCHGSERGAKLGVPTANLDVSREKTFPKNGVYATMASWQRQLFPSVTNVGVRPTFQNEREVGEPIIEVHFLNRNFPLYDEMIEARFIAFIREEKKFNSADALLAQIRKDIDYVKSLSLE